jgi:NAD+ kinase
MNEISVSRKDTTSMITIETSLNGEYLNSYWADGLIISTPTGSTGYSLSCGGPILTPDVKSFVITPIAPHNLNARPLVIPDNTEIKLKVSGREEQYLFH